MVASIIVGAGAEVGAPFRIQGGMDFTWSTFYTRKTSLYDALEKFYSPILKTSDGNSELPNKYQPVFIYEANNPSFVALIKGVVSCEQGLRLVSKHLAREICEESDLLAKDYEVLYDSLIRDDRGDSESVRRLKSYLLSDLPEDAYYGTIEGYFSSLLEPNRRNKSFWKLVNYYWSAFFSVAEPLIESQFSRDSLYKSLGVYQFTLNNLCDVVRVISSDRCLSKYSAKDSYYSAFSNLFDHVLTTNYTPFVHLLKTKGGEKPIRLSGSLTQFETVPDLRICDLTDIDVPGGTFIFPFIMTQIPIKPFIDYSQIHEYARAIEALNRSNIVVVLGYSLCRNDAHIASLIREFVCRDPQNRLLYLHYLDENESPMIEPGEILRRIRLPETYEAQIEIVPIHGFGETALKELKEVLKVKIGCGFSFGN